MDSIGSRLKLWRKHLDLTRSEFAERTGIHPVQLRKYETDASIPGGEIMTKIASTGVNLHWLVTGEGEPALKQAQSKSVENSRATLPAELEIYESELSAIHNLLAAMDEEKRADAIRVIFKHVKDTQRLDELEKMVRDIQASQHASGA